MEQPARRKEAAVEGAVAAIVLGAVILIFLGYRYVRRKGRARLRTWRG